MSRHFGRTLGVLLLLGAGGLGSVIAWRFGAAGFSAAEPTGAPARPAANASEVPAARTVTGRVAAFGQAAVVTSDDLEAEFPPAAYEELDPERATEKQFYERFLARERAAPGHLAGRAAELLLAEGPEPEQVALLRALYEHDATLAADTFLTAIRDLPDVSRASGESVPSFALLYLDRRAQRDAPARSVLLRAAFESPGLGEGLRARAAASFFLNATEVELRAARLPLATEHDGLVRDAALEALSRNASSRVALDLLASHERAPSPTLEAPNEEPR